MEEFELVFFFLSSPFSLMMVWDGWNAGFFFFFFCLFCFVYLPFSNCCACVFCLGGREERKGFYLIFFILFMACATLYLGDISFSRGRILVLEITRGAIKGVYRYIHRST